MNLAGVLYLCMTIMAKRRTAGICGTPQILHVHAFKNNIKKKKKHINEVTQWRPLNQQDHLPLMRQHPLHPATTLAAITAQLFTHQPAMASLPIIEEVWRMNPAIYPRVGFDNTISNRTTNTSSTLEPPHLAQYGIIHTTTHNSWILFLPLNVPELKGFIASPVKQIWKPKVVMTIRTQDIHITTHPYHHAANLNQQAFTNLGEK